MKMIDGEKLLEYVQTEYDWAYGCYKTQPFDDEWVDGYGHCAELITIKIKQLMEESDG
jgi:hypothetical protein